MTKEEQSHEMKLAQEGQVAESKCVWPHLQGGVGRTQSPRFGPSVLRNCSRQWVGVL